EALLELGAALSLQENVEGIASMLAIAIDRLVECAGISIWERDGDVLVPATTVGYTPREAHRLMRARLRVARSRPDPGPDRVPGRRARRHHVCGDRDRRAVAQPRRRDRAAGAAPRADLSARPADAARHRRPGAACDHQPRPLRRARHLV